MEGLSYENLSYFGNNWDSMFGVILFDFTLVTAIPALLYEKASDVSAKSGTCILFFLLKYFL